MVKVLAADGLPNDAAGFDFANHLAEFRRGPKNGVAWLTPCSRQLKLVQAKVAATIWGMGTKVKIEFAIDWYMEVLHYQEVAIG